MPDLLKQDASLDRLAQFDARMVAHPILETVFNKLKSIIRHPLAIPLVMVVGPSGAGKTTLVKRLCADVLNDSAAAMKSNPGYIPITLVEATSPKDGSFDWDKFLEDMLEATHEPMIQQKTMDVFDEDKSKPRKKSSHRELWRAVQQCIRHRGTKITIIDEAQHFGKVLNARRLQDQMDTIKSLASVSGVQFIMVGTKELYTLLNQNGQLARRMRCIHFPRYRWENSADRQAFLNILRMFESRLPVDPLGLLLKNPEYIYEHCLGCVGTLKDWLKLAVREAMDAGRSVLEFSDLEKTAMTNDSLLQLLQEIEEGEARIESDKQQADVLRARLKLQKQNNGEARAAESKPVSPRRAVGERKLARDPVGVAS
jgi:hypothetical protein